MRSRVGVRGGCRKMVCGVGLQKHCYLTVREVDLLNTGLLMGRMERLSSNATPL